ncbi:hypothetical protein BGW39_000830, partial [Mortierella sp. 14UC]
LDSTGRDARQNMYRTLSAISSPSQEPSPPIRLLEDCNTRGRSHPTSGQGWRTSRSMCCFTVQYTRSWPRRHSTIQGCRTRWRTISSN